MEEREVFCVFFMEPFATALCELCHRKSAARGFNWQLSLDNGLTRLLSTPRRREPNRTASQARKGLVVLAMLTLLLLPGDEQLRKACSSYLFPISSNVTVSKRAVAHWGSAGQIQAPSSGT